MHLQEIDPHHRTAIGRISPRLRLAVVFVIITGTALLPRRLDWLYFVPAAILFVLWPLCRMPVGYTLRRLLVVQCFILGLAVLSLLNPASASLVLAAIIKSNLCVLFMLLLTWTTSFPEILQELRRLHLPAVMLSTLALMYRYLPVLAQESRRMQRARASRTFVRKRRLAWENLSTIIAQLFIRSAERAERIYLAMCARGWK
jgi:cobalt/nickel transport system permease protein